MNSVSHTSPLDTSPPYTPPAHSLLDEKGHPRPLLERWRHAKQRRSVWEGHWQECYSYALPLRDSVIAPVMPGAKKGDLLFDGTACDSVDQLAASLLAELTPPWARWFGLTAGVDLDEAERDQLAPLLDKATAIVQSHFDRSNFAAEIHQCYLDAVTGGTACLLFEEAPVGEASAFRFTAVPLAQVALEEGGDGRLDITFRRSEMTLTQIEARFGAVDLPDSLLKTAEQTPDARFAVVEGVVPCPIDRSQGGYDYAAALELGVGEAGLGNLLAHGHFAQNPFISFRWLKAPGEVYGRSPVMKALPDIKTANKVVELVLKNATIAVTGIWQADDDGVMNPANVRLTPGTIIPKAVGSAGLQPLQAPGRFDISQLVLDDLRNRIRHALLADKLGQPNVPTMTATEVVERSREMARLLGATYGRLQAELLTPLVVRAVHILKRRGEIPPLILDGHLVDLQYRSPLAQNQAQRDSGNLMTWLSAVSQLGPNAMSVVDPVATARWLGRCFQVPAELLTTVTPGVDPAGAALAQGLGALLPQAVNPNEQEV